MKRLIEIVILLSLACGAAPMRLQAAEAATTSASSTVIRTALPVAPPVHRVLELEQIVVTGNSHISDSEILETLGLAPHDTVNVSILEDARLRLLKDFPLLKSVDLSTSPGSRRGLIILDIAVVERNPVVFETGYGLHDTYGWFLTLLGIRIDPAAAYGTEYRLGLRLGFHIAGLDGEFEQHPKPGRIGLGGNFHLYSQDQIFFAGESAPGIWDATDATRYSRQFRQKIKRSGAELYLFSKLADSTKFSFGYHVEGVRPESSFVESESGQKYQFADFPSSLQTGIKNSTITGLVFRVVRDTRDLLAYPRAGSFGLVQVQTNSTILGGDETFVKADGDLRKHIGLGGWSVLSSRLSAGIVSKRTPYYERFFLGGMYSIRGFRGLSLSPPRGSDGFMIGSEEFRFPLIASRANVPPKLTGLVFVDAGIGWVRGEAFKASDIEAAAGYGVRLRLPWIGTLGIDAGVPFTDGRTGDQFYIHGCLGFSF